MWHTVFDNHEVRLVKWTTGKFEIMYFCDGCQEFRFGSSLENVNRMHDVHVYA